MGEILAKYKYPNISNSRQNIANTFKDIANKINIGRILFCIMDTD